MIELTKLAPPQVLLENAEVWTETYARSGKTTRPWAHPEIKDALLRETGEKCAYCEARVLAVSFGDIEHIRPKSLFPELVVDWNNLTLACSKCNQHKGSKFDGEIAIVNPYSDQISSHLLFLGSFVFAISDRGEYTLELLQLNDPSRLEARQRVIAGLESLMRRRDKADSDWARRNLTMLIDAYVSSGEYLATSRSYAENRNQIPADAAA